MAILIKKWINVHLTIIITVGGWCVKKANGMRRNNEVMNSHSESNSWWWWFGNLS